MISQYTETNFFISSDRARSATTRRERAVTSSSSSAACHSGTARSPANMTRTDRQEGRRRNRHLKAPRHGSCLRFRYCKTGFKRNWLLSVLSYFLIFVTLITESRSCHVMSCHVTNLIKFISYNLSVPRTWGWSLLCTNRSNWRRTGLRFNYR